MEGLTREEAIRRERMAWEWLASEILKQKRCLSMIDAFNHFGWHIPRMGPIRWACMHDAMTHGQDCSHCVLKWPSKVKTCACLDYYEHEDDKGIYSQYLDAVYYRDWRKEAYFAKYISMLPENSEYLKED